MEQMANVGGGGDEWQMRSENLERAHQQLQGDLKQQQKVTAEVKKEAATFLREMKALSERSNQNAEREEKLVRQVQRLEDEIKDWRGRYTKVKSQLRTLRAPSMSSPTQQPDMDQLLQNRGFLQQDGLVKHVHVTRFQISVDELLRTARVSEPSSVLAHVRSVVIAVRNIDKDVASIAPASNDEAQQMKKLQLRISATANNLITAAKNFAIANGLSPVSLLDAAASHLTVSIVELIRIIKIKASSPGELEDDDDNSLINESPAAYYGMPNGRRSLGDESVYSGISSSQPPLLPTSYHVQKNTEANRRPAYQSGITNGGPYHAAPQHGLGISAQDAEVEELKVNLRTACGQSRLIIQAFLEDQTEGLVQSIQSLVGSIRAEETPPTIKGHIDDIAGIVGKIVSETQQRLSNSDKHVLQDQANPSVDILAECRSRLVDTSVEVDRINDATAWKEFTKMLPPLAFKIARETKELVQRLDRMGAGDDDDEFR